MKKFRLFLFAVLISFTLMDAAIVKINNKRSYPIWVTFTWPLQINNEHGGSTDVLKVGPLPPHSSSFHRVPPLVNNYYVAEKSELTKPNGPHHIQISFLDQATIDW